MTLKDINSRLNDLEHTRRCLYNARNKFDGNKNKVDNYLGYDNISIAIECVEAEIARFEAKDWK